MVGVLCFFLFVGFILTILNLISLCHYLTFIVPTTTSWYFQCFTEQYNIWFLLTYSSYFIPKFSGSICLFLDSKMRENHWVHHVFFCRQKLSTAWPTIYIATLSNKIIEMENIVVAARDWRGGRRGGCVYKKVEQRILVIGLLSVSWVKWWLDESTPVLKLHRTKYTHTHTHVMRHMKLEKSV